MAVKTLNEIEDFVSGTIVTELIIEDNDYPYYYLGETCLGWAEYLDTSNFDPFELLGFTVKIVRVEVDSAYNDQGGKLDYAMNKIINDSENLTTALAELEDLGSQISIVRV